MTDPASVLLVGGDLMARARVEQAASAAGAAMASASPEGLEEALRASAPGLVVVDLDACGAAILPRLEAARAAGLLQGRVLAFYSHVDEALGDAARAAGCEALPRGRFWRTLPELVGAS